MKRILSSVGYGLTLAVFALLAVASGGKREGGGDDGGTGTATAASGPAKSSSITTTFETIEVARPTSEDVKLKIDVPAGTQVKADSRTTVLTKGESFAIEITAEKQTIADLKTIMAGTDSGWSDVKIVKDTPNVVVFKGRYLGKSRTRIHSSASPKGFFTTCSNPVTAMGDSAAIDDMIRTCESFGTNAGGSAATTDKKAAPPPKAAPKAPKKP
jgi:hypothetical protein